jgi:methylmalonyl-CoA/ethylmalonyl-CoA epimerase
MSNETATEASPVTDTTAVAVHFDKIGQIAITVRDLARAKHFYQDTLGMTHLFDAGTMSFFQCGDVRLLVGASEEPAILGGTILYFKVADIHATCAKLMERGIVFHQAPHLVARMPDHELWIAFLKDPDENIIGVMSEIPRV